MEEPKLRPMDIGDILDNSFRLYKSNFTKFVAIMTPIYIIIFIASVIYQYSLEAMGISNMSKGPSGSTMGLFFITIAFFMLSMVISAILRFVATGALVHSVSGAYLGKDIRYKEAYKNVSIQFWPLVGLGFLSGLMTGIGFYMLFIPGVLLSVFLAFSVHAMVLEKDTVGGSIARSFGLASYSFGKTFLVCLIAFLILGIASAIANLPLFIWGFTQGLTGQEFAQPPLIAQVFQVALNNFIQLVTAPFWLIAITLLYYDIRIRKEGFDLEIMAQGLGYQIPGAQENSQSTP